MHEMQISINCVGHVKYRKQYQLSEHEYNRKLKIDFRLLEISEPMFYFQADNEKEGNDASFLLPA